MDQTQRKAIRDFANGDVRKNSPTLKKEKEAFYFWMSAYLQSGNLEDLDHNVPSSQIPKPESFINSSKPQLFAVFETSFLVRFRTQIMKFIAELRHLHQVNDCPIRFVMPLVVLEELDMCDHPTKNDQKNKDAKGEHSTERALKANGELEVDSPSDDRELAIRDLFRRPAHPRAFMRFIETEMRAGLIVGDVDPHRTQQLPPMKITGHDDRILECCIRTKMFIEAHTPHPSTQVVFMTKKGALKSKAIELGILFIELKDLRGKYLELGREKCPTPQTIDLSSDEEEGANLAENSDADLQIIGSSLNNNEKPLLLKEHHSKHLQLQRTSAKHGLQRGKLQQSKRTREGSLEAYTAEKSQDERESSPATECRKKKAKSRAQDERQYNQKSQFNEKANQSQIPVCGQQSHLRHSPNPVSNSNLFLSNFPGSSVFPPNGQRYLTLTPGDHWAPQQWFYTVTHGPFSADQMSDFYQAGQFSNDILIGRAGSSIFHKLGDVMDRWNITPTPAYTVPSSPQTSFQYVDHNTNKPVPQPIQVSAPSTIGPSPVHFYANPFQRGAPFGFF